MMRYPISSPWAWLSFDGREVIRSNAKNKLGTTNSRLSNVKQEQGTEGPAFAQPRTIGPRPRPCARCCQPVKSDRGLTDELESIFEQASSPIRYIMRSTIHVRHVSRPRASYGPSALRPLSTKADISAHSLRPTGMEDRSCERKLLPLFFIRNR